MGTRLSDPAAAFKHMHRSFLGHHPRYALPTEHRPRRGSRYLALGAHLAAEPMAPRTRAAKARAAAAAEATCHLLDLSHDEQSIVTHELCDPLRPLLSVHLSSTAKGLWVPMQEQLAELRQRHAEGAAMARARCAALADATQAKPNVRASVSYALAGFLGYALFYDFTPRSTPHASQSQQRQCKTTCTTEHACSCTQAGHTQQSSPSRG